MTHAGGGTENDRDAPALRNFQRGENKIVGFLGIGRFQQGHPRCHRVAAIVLFVLAGGHARIICGNDHQPAHHTGVGRGEQWIGGDVQADVFHRGHGPGAGECRPQGDLQRDLFIGRPLAASAEGCEAFQDFRGGSAGIAGSECHAGVARGKGDGFIAAEELSFFSGHACLR